MDVPPVLDESSESRPGAGLGNEVDEKSEDLESRSEHWFDGWRFSWRAILSNDESVL